jgi:hypothetical protein
MSQSVVLGGHVAGVDDDLRGVRFREIEGINGDVVKRT